MTVKTYNPAVSVILKKTVQRTTVAGSSSPTSSQYQGSDRNIDLTPLLGENSMVTVSKSIRDAEGMFSIVLSDQLDPQTMDTVYALVEPMDVIEIRMAHDPSQYASGGYTGTATAPPMPLMMRGIVSLVARDEEMADKPKRGIVITGQDYGKFLKIMQIAYLPNEVTGQHLLTYFKFFQAYDPEASAYQSAGDFVTGIVNNVVNGFLGSLAALGGAGSPILGMQVNSTVSKGNISPFGTVQNFEGNLYQMMCKYGDVGPWNELFVQDQEDGVYLVYRPVPFKDPTGNLTDSSATIPDSISLTDADLVKLHVERSDSSVFNYYWVNPLTYALNTPGYLQVDAAKDPSTVYIADYQNSDVDLYGFRRLETGTMQGQRIDGQQASDYQEGQGNILDFVKDRRATLVANNRDNVVFETGSMILAGNENVKAGMTISLARGSQKKPSEYYAVSVQHSIRPFSGTYTTVATFERGTGFINRVQNSGGSPYLQEMSAGGAYGGK